MVLWKIPGDVTRVDVQKLVNHVFREEQASPTGPRPRKKEEPHIFKLGIERERTAVRRWLQVGGAQLLRELGLPGSWWCGLFLPRKDVFGEITDGDIDLLAGPLEFELNDEQWQACVAQESRRWPLGAARMNVINSALLRSAEEGLIRWPPRMDAVVACEVKASWFRPHPATWKATHKGEAARVKGQIRLLIDRGIDRVGFLHLGATEPREIGRMNPWLQAAADAAEAEDRFELLFSPAEVPTCGYFTAVMGSVPFAPEDTSGAGGVLRVHQLCSPNHAKTQGWRTQLQLRLAQLPRPTWPTAFVLVCPSCANWNLCATPRGTPCPCLSPRPGQGATP